ncbi:AfsR/SARP family transcriptional regulator [Streptomyces sp. NRRL S-237]|uniref:AfsR/SARP family transcriptional regulator n=1 Tax=Streptomyces sp. NRRL S-237 TaxID=1463895 RepID=UPI0004CA8E64|nr:BTAD domain-containing putative transcriptional regulator [Streptomyces sp. NRRL S-237]
MRVGVLGPLMMWTGDGDGSGVGEPVAVTGARVRRLLARLLVEPGRPVSADRLVDALWGGPDAELPLHPYASLQGQVSRLRAALERAAPSDGRGRLLRDASGYRLEPAPGELDAQRFAELAARARAQGLAPRPRAALLGEALSLWRGEAYAGHTDDPAVRAAAARLEEERLSALEELLGLRVSLGEQHAVLGELDQLVAAHPLRERLRAVQLRALYRAGRQAQALESYEVLRGRLAQDLGLDPGRELTALRQAILRQDADLDRPPHEENAGTTGDARPPDPGGVPPAAPWPAPQAAPRATPRTAQVGAVGQLPEPLTRLVGRDADLAAVGALSAHSRLVTVTGPGGVGKTRLAVAHAAGQASARHPDGAWLVELAPLPAGAPADAVATAVLRTLGVHGPEADPTAGGKGQRPDALRLLVAALRERRILLLLDNCEHLSDAVAEVLEAVLPQAPGLSVLVTGQEPLALVGEAVYPLAPLAPADAVALFTARAGLPPDRTTTPADTAAVAALCARLDGLPLALELAAARARALGVHGLLAGLDDRFTLLSRGLRGVPPRQRTLRAVIDWSWALLGGAEEAVLRRLSVHGGDASAQAAGVVCSDAAAYVREHQVPLLLDRLVERSLVVLVDRPEGRRYRLLESVKDYARERLRAAGEETEVRARHGAYYRELALRAEPLLRGPRQRLWLARLDAAEAELHPAVEEALAHGRVVPALRAARALARYRLLRGGPGEGGRLLDACLAAERDRTAHPDHPAHPHHPGHPLAGERIAATALATAWRAGLTVLEGAPRAAGGLLRSAAATLDAREVAEHDPLGHAHALSFLAAAQMGTGDVATGEELADRALAVAEGIGDAWGTALALSVRARHALAHGDLAAVRRDAERAARLFGRLGDRWGMSQTVFPRAALHEIAGEYPQASRLHEEGLAIAEELGLRTEAGKRLCALGRSALLAGAYEESRRRHADALRLAGEQGHRAGEADARIGLAMVARRIGDLAGAEEHMRAVLAWFRDADYGPGTTLALAELGFTAELRGEPDRARALHREGLAAARALGDVRAVALALEGLAGAAAVAGEPERAARLLGAADAARASVGAPLPPAERHDVDRTWSTCLSALGRTAVEAAFALGATHPPEAEPAAGD